MIDLSEYPGHADTPITNRIAKFAKGTWGALGCWTLLLGYDPWGDRKVSPDLFGSKGDGYQYFQGQNHWAGNPQPAAVGSPPFHWWLMVAYFALPFCWIWVDISDINKSWDFASHVHMLRTTIITETAGFIPFLTTPFSRTPPSKVRLVKHQETLSLPTAERQHQSHGTVLRFSWPRRNPVLPARPHGSPSHLPAMTVELLEWWNGWSLEERCFLQYCRQYIENLTKSN